MPHTPEHKETFKERRARAYRALEGGRVSTPSPVLPTPAPEPSPVAKEETFEERRARAYQGLQDVSVATPERPVPTSIPQRPTPAPLQQRPERTPTRTASARSALTREENAQQFLQNIGGDLTGFGQTDPARPLPGPLQGLGTAVEKVFDPFSYGSSEIRNSPLGDLANRSGFVEAVTGDNALTGFGPGDIVAKILGLALEQSPVSEETQREFGAAGRFDRLVAREHDQPLLNELAGGVFDPTILGSGPLAALRRSLPFLRGASTAESVAAPAARGLSNLERLRNVPLDPGITRSRASEVAISGRAPEAVLPRAAQAPVEQAVPLPAAVPETTAAEAGASQITDPLGRTLHFEDSVDADFYTISGGQSTPGYDEALDRIRSLSSSPDQEIEGIASLVKNKVSEVGRDVPRGGTVNIPRSATQNSYTKPGLVDQAVPPPATAPEVPVAQVPETIPSPQGLREAGDSQLAKFPIERQPEVRQALLAADDATHQQAFTLFESSKARTLRSLPREAEDAYDDAWRQFGIEPPPRGFAITEAETLRDAGRLMTGEQIAALPPLPKSTVPLEDITPAFGGEGQGTQLGFSPVESVLGRSQLARSADIPSIPAGRELPTLTESQRVARNLELRTTPTPTDVTVPPGGGGQGELFTASDLPPISRNVWQEVREATSIPRALLATGDLSATLRQGGVLAYGHPTRASKTFGRVLKNSFSDEASEALILSMKQNPDYERFVLDDEVGLFFAEQGDAFSKREELFANQTLQKIPVLGSVVKFSERNYVNYLNKLRLDVMGDVVRGWERSGPKASKKELKQLATFVNHATGRGTLGSLETIAPELTAAFFSPRLAISRGQLIWDFLKLADPRTSWRVRKTIAKDMTAFVTVNSMMLAMLAAVPGVTVGTNYLANDFGLVRIGRTRYDFWAGNQQLARAVIQTIRGKRATPSGREIPQPIHETVGRYLQSKLSPNAQLVPDVAVPLSRGKQPTDFLGRPIKTDPKSVFFEVLKRTVPLTLQDIWDAGREEGISNAPKGTPGLVGVGVQTFATFDEQVEDRGAELGAVGDLWPFERVGIAREIRAETGRSAEGYGLAIDQLRDEEAEALVTLGDNPGRLSSGQQSQAYFRITRDFAKMRSGAARVEFGKEDFSNEPGSTPEARALQEYYDLIGGSLTSKQLSAAIQRQEKVWQRNGTLGYVQANTNVHPIPRTLINKLPGFVQNSDKARTARINQRRPNAR